MAARRSAGMIGAGLPSRFRAIVDVAHDTLRLEADGTLSRPFENDRSGLHVEYRKGVLEVQTSSSQSTFTKEVR